MDGSDSLRRQHSGHIRFDWIWERGPEPSFTQQSGPQAYRSPLSGTSISSRVWYRIRGMCPDWEISVFGNRSLVNLKSGCRSKLQIRNETVLCMPNKAWEKPEFKGKRVWCFSYSEAQQYDWVFLVSIPLDETQQVGLHYWRKFRRGLKIWHHYQYSREIQKLQDLLKSHSG